MGVAGKQMRRTAPQQRLDAVAAICLTVVADADEERVVKLIPKVLWVGIAAGSAVLGLVLVRLVRRRATA